MFSLKTSLLSLCGAVVCLAAAAAPANNLDCLTCHAGLAGEPLVVRHIGAEEPVACTRCHGPSEAHAADGTGVVTPDLMHGRAELDVVCTECHAVHENGQAVEAFRDKHRGQRRGDGPVIGDAAVCTDCHGMHWQTGLDGGGPWTPLFNGESLDGWRAEGNADWRVENGLLVGRQGEANAPGDLFTEAEFDDFELIVTWQVVWPANTGVWFRYQSAAVAYQADILEYTNPVCWSGSLYCPGKVFIDMNEDEKLVNREGWNSFRIRAEGDHLTIDLNGTQVADVRDDSTDHGSVGFQVHAGDQFGTMEVRVREVLIRPLK